MPILTEQRKRQKNLITAMVFVVIVTLLVLYFGIMRREVPEEKRTEGTDLLTRTREVGLNVDLLQDKRFKALIPYDKLSREIKTGRNNPFVPYSIIEPVYVSENEEARLEEGSATSTKTIPDL